VATAPPGLTPAVVTHVVDGDTIDVEIDGVEYTVRYIGVNTPETVDPRRGVECFGPEASAFNKQLVEGQTVGLEKDVSETEYGRCCGMWLGGEMVNATLVRRLRAVSTYRRRSTDVPRVAAEAAEQVAGCGVRCGAARRTPGGGVGACEFSGRTRR
jgi:endonuclease YncB( thermonuclease family)